MSGRLYFCLFQRLYIFLSISFSIYFGIIFLTYISKFGEEGLVYDYLFTSQREPHSVPDMDFFLYCAYFVPFGVIENRVTKITSLKITRVTNFKYFNGICYYSRCPGWSILFLYATAHKGLAFWKKISFELDYHWASFSLHFHIVLKPLVSY